MTARRIGRALLVMACLTAIAASTARIWTTAAYDRRVLAQARYEALCGGTGPLSKEDEAFLRGAIRKDG